MFLEKPDRFYIQGLFDEAKFYYDNQELLDAKILFNKVKKYDKKFKLVNYYLALIKLSENKLYDAQKLLEKEIKYNPENNDAKELLESLEIEQNWPVCTLAILFLNLIIMVFNYPETSFIDLIKYAGNNQTFSLTSIFTSIFFHANLLHFALNFVFLAMFGFIVEKLFGSVRFFMIFISSAFLGNMVQVILSSEMFVLGSSAGIFGIIGALTLKEPLMKVKMFGFFNMPLILVFGAYFTLTSFFLEIFISEDLVIGQLAHLIGFLVGILFTGIFYNHHIEVFYSWLTIFFGFWVFKFVYNLVKMFNFGIIEGVYIVFLVLLGGFLVYFGYHNLKFVLNNIKFKK